MYSGYTTKEYKNRRTNEAVNHLRHFCVNKPQITYVNVNDDGSISFVLKDKYTSYMTGKLSCSKYDGLYDGVDIYLTAIESTSELVMMHPSIKLEHGVILRTIN
jgi:hypothetical protein